MKVRDRAWTFVIGFSLLLVIACLSLTASATTLTVAAVEGSQEVWSSILEEFESQHPGVKVQVNWFPGNQLRNMIMLAHVAGQFLADVFMVYHDWLPSLADAGALMDLSSYKDAFIEAGITPVRLDGITLGLPFRPRETWEVCTSAMTKSETEAVEFLKAASRGLQVTIQVSITARNEVGLTQNLGNATGTPLLPINPLTGKGRVVELTVFAYRGSHNRPAAGQPVTVYSTLKNYYDEQIAVFKGADPFTCADGSLALCGVTNEKGYFAVRLEPLNVSETKAYADAEAARMPTGPQRQLLLRKNFGVGIDTIRIGAEARKLQKSDKPTYSEAVRVTLFEIVAELKVQRSLYSVTYSPYVKEAYDHVKRRLDKGLPYLQTPRDVRYERSVGGSWSTGYSYAGGLRSGFSISYFSDQGIRAILGGAENGSMSVLVQTPLLDGFTPDIRDLNFDITEKDPFQYAYNKIVAATVGYSNAPITLRTEPAGIWQGTLKSAGLAFRAEATGDLKLYAHGNAPIVNPGNAAATALGALLTLVPGTSPLFNIGTGALLSKLASEINGNAWLSEQLGESLFGKRDASTVANFAASVYSRVPEVSTDKQNDGNTITLSKSATRLRNDCGTKSDIDLTLKYYASTELQQRRVTGICALEKSTGSEPEGNRVLQFNRQFRSSQPLPVSPEAGPVMFLDLVLTASAIRSNERAYAAINIGLSEPLLRIINVEFGE